MSQSNMNRITIGNVLLMLTIFVIDISVPLGVAAGVPYIACVLISMWLPDPKQTITFAAASVFCILVGYVMSPDVIRTGFCWMVLSNRILAIGAVCVTAVMCLKLEKACIKKLEYARLEAAVRMAGAVCHEMAQPIQGIMGYATLIKEYPEEYVNPEVLGELEKQSARIGKLLHQLQGIRRPGIKPYLDNDISELRDAVRAWQHLETQTISKEDA